MIYLQLNIPFLFWVKIGYTGLFSLKQRTRQVDKDTPGVLIPIPLVIVPGALYIEKQMHRWLGKYAPFLKIRFYRGDGKTEWYWFPAAILPVGFAAATWYFYYLIFQAIYYGQL